MPSYNDVIWTTPENDLAFTQKTASFNDMTIDRNKTPTQSDNADISILSFANESRARLRNDNQISGEYASQKTTKISDLK